MRILISNDDGVHAPGIQVLVNSLSIIADIDVIAPDRNRSGASNSLTLSRPLRVRCLDNGHHSVDGTPTDCVHLGLTGYFDTHADMVVTGINEGANLGDDVLYSGTVAAAMEGRFLGLPAIAVSLVGPNPTHYETAGIIARQLVLKLQTQNLPSQTILNVNIPNVPFDEIKGIDVTRLGSRHRAEPVIRDVDPRGRSIYWIGPPGTEADSGPGTDFFAISQGRVSITPLQLDMTHYKIFDTLATLVNDLTLSDEQ
jgi:5'-nucleotidase